MRIGYARVSSKDQNISRQLEALKDTEKVFQDKESGSTKNRDGLTALLNFLREGDVVVVSELERLGRNNKELTELIQEINAKGATLEVLNLPCLNGVQDENLRRLLNNMIIEIYKYQSQVERENIRRRQAEGIALAKKQGKYKGRQPKFKENDDRLLHAFDLFLEGKTDNDVEKLTGISSRTFRRYRQKYNIKRL